MADDVVLVGHSYVGAVISEAVEDRTDVAHLVYVAAFCLGVDESVRGFISVQPDQDYALAKALVLAEGGTTVTVEPFLAREVFYSDCTDNRTCSRSGWQRSSAYATPPRRRRPSAEARWS